MSQKRQAFRVYNFQTKEYANSEDFALTQDGMLIQLEPDGTPDGNGSAYYHCEPRKYKVEFDLRGLNHID